MCRTNDCLFRVVINWCDTFYGCAPTLIVIKLADGDGVEVPVPAKYCRACRPGPGADNAALFNAVLEWSRHNFGQGAQRLEIHFPKGRPLSMPVREPDDDPAARPELTPCEADIVDAIRANGGPMLMDEILAALDGRHGESTIKQALSVLQKYKGVLHNPKDGKGYRLV